MHLSYCLLNVHFRQLHLPVLPLVQQHLCFSKDDVYPLDYEKYCITLKSIISQHLLKTLDILYFKVLGYINISGHWHLY